MLEKHLSINDISNTCVVAKAISDFVGTASFSVEGHSTSRLSAEGHATVQVTTLDELVMELGSPPDLMKVDIEGAEVEMLRGAKKILDEFRPVIFLALHSKGIFDDLVETVPKWKYVIKELDGADVRGADYRDEVVLFPAEFRV